MTGLNAITFATADMAAAVSFYEHAGFDLAYGGPGADFTSFRLGGGTFLNLSGGEVRSAGFWGRVIIHVASPDEVHERLTAAGYPARSVPADAPWGERYFHILDPDGNEVSFARVL